MEERNDKELHEPEFLPHRDSEPFLEGGEEEEDLSATDRVLYVVTSPKRAFQGLHRARLGSVIGIGILVSVALLVLSTVLMFSSDKFVEQIKAERIQGLEKVLDQPGLSESDKQSIEKQIEETENASPTTFMVFGSIFPAVGMVLILLILALIVFIIAKVLETGRETRVKYGQALAVTSLSSIITGLIGVVFAVLALATGSVELAKGIGAVVQTDSAVLDALIGALSPQYIWWYIVTGIGIAAISKSSVVKSTLSFASVMIVCLVVLGVIGRMFGEMFV